MTPLYSSSVVRSGLPAPVLKNHWVTSSDLSSGRWLKGEDSTWQPTQLRVQGLDSPQETEGSAAAIPQDWSKKVPIEKEQIMTGIQTQRLNVTQEKRSVAKSYTEPKGIKKKSSITRICIGNTRVDYDLTIRQLKSEPLEGLSKSPVGKMQEKKKIKIWTHPRRAMG